MNLNLFHILLALLFKYEFKYKKNNDRRKKNRFLILRYIMEIKYIV